jgi:type IV pilus assembly protein PilY1
VTPASGAIGVNRRTTVTAKFSEPVTTGTVKSETFYLDKDGANSPISTTVSYGSTTQTATLKPSARLDANATYKATVDGVTDPAGNRNTPYSWSFTTGG